MAYLDLSLLNLLEGDCLLRLVDIPDQSVNLVVTFPPYAEQRKGKYDGVDPERYIEWFVPIANQIKRILSPSGSFFLNIKANCDNGERLLYVYELILALRNKVGFKFIDEYIWYKSASPRRKSYRLKDAWEPIFHFSNGKNYINHDAIKIHSDSTFGEKRGYSSYNDKTGNIGGYHEICKQVPGFTDPDNILYFPTSLLVKDVFPHPAKFPRELVDFLIRGFCPEGGTVCDPFCGSGTTALAALIRDRKCIAIEKEAKFCDMIKERVLCFEPPPPLKPTNGIKSYDMFGPDGEII